MPQGPAVATHAERSGSWMLSEAKSEDLLYVSSSSGVSGIVRVYSYPHGRRIGTLTSLTYANGECVDPAGDVFIIESSGSASAGSTVYEYAHGGSTPIATLADPGAGFGCAVDSTTGNLAVANTTDPSNPNHGYGDVAIYAGAQGRPTMYRDPDLSTFWYCGYDDQGNLYLSVSQDAGREAQLVRLATGSSSFEPISLNQVLYTGQLGFLFVPSVQWDGEHITVSSASKSADDGYTGVISVYRLSISGSAATIIGTTKLESEKDIQRGESWIQGKNIIGIDQYHGDNVSSWPYPSGGLSPHTIARIKNAVFGFGVTVSIAPK
jgi:hypothetical protein